MTHINPDRLVLALEALAAEYGDRAAALEVRGQRSHYWQMRTFAAERAAAHVRAGIAVAWDAQCETLLVSSASEPGVIRRVSKDACDCPAPRHCYHLEVRIAADRMLDAEMMAVFEVGSWADDYDGEGAW